MLAAHGEIGSRGVRLEPLLLLSTAATWRHGASCVHFAV